MPSAAEGLLQGFLTGQQATEEKRRYEQQLKLQEAAVQFNNQKWLLDYALKQKQSDNLSKRLDMMSQHYADQAANWSRRADIAQQVADGRITIEQLKQQGMLDRETMTIAARTMIARGATMGQILTRFGALGMDPNTAFQMAQEAGNTLYAQGAMTPGVPGAQPGGMPQQQGPAQPQAQGMPQAPQQGAQVPPALGLGPRMGMAPLPVQGFQTPVPHGALPVPASLANLRAATVKVDQKRVDQMGAQIREIGARTKLTEAQKKWWDQRPAMDRTRLNLEQQRVNIDRAYKTWQKQKGGEAQKSAIWSRADNLVKGYTDMLTKLKAQKAKVQENRDKMQAVVSQAEAHPEYLDAVKAKNPQQFIQDANQIDYARKSLPSLDGVLEGLSDEISDREQDIKAIRKAYPMTATSKGGKPQLPNPRGMGAGAAGALPGFTSGETLKPGDPRRQQFKPLQGKKTEAQAQREAKRKYGPKKGKHYKMDLRGNLTEIK